MSATNEHHNWRIRVVPGVTALCVVCNTERLCTGFDHDLRGHVCEEDLLAVIAAEAALTDARLEQPTDSILDQPL